MTSFTDVLTGAKAERHVIATRLEALDTLIAHMEDYQTKYAPTGAAPLMIDQGETETRERTAHPDAISRDMRAEAPAPADVTPPLRAKGTTMTPDGLAHAIVEQLARGPLIAGRLARAVKASQADVKRWLAQAKNDGRVERHGYRWQLVPARAARVQAPAESKTLKDAVAAAPGTGPTCKRCDCAFSDHDPDSGKCYGKKGKCVCLEFYR